MGRVFKVNSNRYQPSLKLTASNNWRVRVSAEIKTYEESVSNITTFRLDGQIRYELRMIAIMADDEVSNLKGEIIGLKQWIESIELTGE